MKFMISIWLAALICVGLGAVRVAAAPDTHREKTVRTLETITIEGEIAVPQVLFITSRDQPRYRDGLASRFRPGALDVARATRMPVRMRVVANMESPKEEKR